MKNKIFLVYIFSIITLWASSQETVQKVTKTSDYQFEDCSSISIRGEKANIKITGKNQNHIELKVLYIAKHKNLKTATADLKKIIFQSNKSGNQLLLSNFYDSGNKNIESNLSITFELIVPENIAIRISNLYGNVNLNHLKIKKVIEISFGKLELNSISGNTMLNLRYTDVKGQHCEGMISGNLSKSDMSINNCMALIDLKTNYGKLNLDCQNTNENIFITGKKTEVNVSIAKTKDYNLELITSHNDIVLFGKTVSQKYSASSKPTSNKIKIKTSYCPINIISR